MNLKQVQDMLVAVADLQVPFALRSAPGIGKTQVIYQLARRLAAQTKKNWSVCSLVAGQYDHPDLVGFNVPSRKADGSGLTAQLTEPFWWSQIEHADGVDNFVILFLDEYADCEFANQKVLAQICNERRVGTRSLPKGVWVLLAGNRRKDKSGVQRTASMFQNRITEIEIDYDIDLHADRMITTGMHPIGISFIQLKGATVFNGEVPADPGPFYTPRSFEKSVRTLARYSLAIGVPQHRLSTDSIAEEILTGDIGAAAAGEFKRHIAYGDEVPDLEEIMLDPDRCRLSDQLAGQYITALMLSQRINDKQIDPACTYIERLKTELQVIAFKALIDRYNTKGELPGLFVSRRFSAWAGKHRDVIMMAA